ncbi:MAG: methyltransferase domain-containing protein [Elusimicrobia bacterium]|nr:methyltransferase domain-containing protein [Elusimicrobiota bacterium]
MKPPALRVPKDWWRKLFTPEFFDPADKLHLALAPMQAAFLMKALRLKRGAALLDLCCGPGRHSLLLARKGLRVTGLDLSKPYLRRARERARRLKLPVRFVLADMRALPFRAEFDAVINLFTSFGYFHRQSENLAVLRGVRRALKPGGLLFMEMMHRGWVTRNFTARDWTTLDGGYLLEERKLLAGGRRIATRWVRVYPDGRRLERRLALHNYDQASLSALLRRAGLEPVRFWGGFAGEPLRQGSKRLMVLARAGGRRT